MSYTKTVAYCETYYHPNNHLQAYSWRKYNADEKNAAFNQAKRELEVSLGRDLEDPSSDTATYQDPYAHYEQALYILENTPRQLQDGVAQVVDLAKDENAEKIDRRGVGISPQAKRFFAINVLKFVRG